MDPNLIGSPGVGNTLDKGSSIVIPTEHFECGPRRQAVRIDGPLTVITRPVGNRSFAFKPAVRAGDREPWQDKPYRFDDSQTDFGTSRRPNVFYKPIRLPKYSRPSRCTIRNRCPE